MRNDNRKLDVKIDSFSQTIKNDKDPVADREIDSEKYWSIDETASYLGYTPRWLRELAKKGMFYPVKVGKRWLFKKSLIDKYISEGNGN